MSKQDLLKIQTCVLKVNIHCDGCEHKVRKLLQKIDGVYSVNINAGQGKVEVSGNVDPGKLIKKLKSSGKHAELWGGPRGMMFPTNQFKNLQIDQQHGKGGKDNKSHKGGKDQHKGVGQAQLPHSQNKPSKDHKSVKFNLPEDDFDASDDGFDDSDDYDDEEDEEEQGHGRGHSHPMPNKMMNGHKGNSGGGGGGINANKGDVMDVVAAMQMKGKGGNKESKNGHGGKKNNGGDGGKKTKGGGGGGNKKDTKSSGGFLGRFLGLGQKGGDKNKNKNKNKNKGGGGGGNNQGKKGKKGGGKFEGHEMDNIDDDYYSDEFDIPHHAQGGKGGKGSNGNGKSKGNGNGNSNMGQMGPNPMGYMGSMEQMRNIAAVQGLPAMNGGGYYQGMQMQPPPPQYNPQQQYMAMMMNHNQQFQPHLNGMYPQPPPMMYGRPYMPPPPPVPIYPGPDTVTHAFSDENTESCTIM